MKKGRMLILAALWLAASTLLTGCGNNRVVYDGNGATAGSVPVDIEKYHPGQEVMVLDNDGGLVKSRHVFAGWNTQADGYGVTYMPDQILTMGTQNITLYAKWMYRVVYIYKSTDTNSATAATSFETLLDPVYPADLIDMSQIATADFSQYSLIIIGRGVGPLTADQATVIQNTVLPVIGIHGGGAGYFQLIESYMIWDHTASGLHYTSATVVNPAHTIWNLPNDLNVSGGATVTIFTSETQGSVLYKGYAPSDVIHVAEVSSSYDAIAIQGRNLYWAFYNDASNFTDAGGKLFINAINHMVTN